MGSLGVLDNTDDMPIVTMDTTGRTNIAKGGRYASGLADPDWERYGLMQAAPKTIAVAAQGGDGGGGDDDKDYIYQGHNPCDNDLFAEDKSLTSRPWWKANFFLSEPVLFGTWDGVFTSCMINIFGVIIFLRSGWVVAEAGIMMSVLIIFLALAIVLVTVFSAVGISGRCQVERGGVYFIVSHVLGARLGGAVGFLYCFGQIIGAAILVIGFGETMGEIFHLDNVWLQRLSGVTIFLLLIAINLLGVVWVIKVQFVLLLILLLAALDFTVGSFIRVDTIHGVDGYHSNNFFNNSAADYSEGNSYFTIFGVFFPTMTGILAGINMSGDLRNSRKDIPVGTLSALTLSVFLYLVFVFVLGASCQRWALRTDFMIAEKISAVGVLFIAGLCVSSLSSCLGGLYSTPRVLQCIANENIVPFMSAVGRGRGPNQVPVLATLLVGVVVIMFVLVGEINALAPIATMSYLFTYAAIDYAYFSLDMTFDIQKQRQERMRIQGMLSPTFDQTKPLLGNGYGAVTAANKVTDDLDTLFPERTKSRPVIKRQYSSQTSSIVTSPDEHSSIRSDDNGGRFSTKKQSDSCEGITDLSQLIAKGGGGGGGATIVSKSKLWYYALSNRWICLFGVLVNLLVMFCVQWMFALANIAFMLMLYFYIYQANPGASPGIAEFKLLPWIKRSIMHLFGCVSPESSHIVVTPMHPGVEVMAAQLTEDNEDYSARERYHQSVVHGSRFDEFDDD